MGEKPFQDYYPDHFSYCYGCGRLNEHGLQIKSTWEGEEAVCTFTPRPYHMAIPGYVYGGLIASLIDCHGTGTAAAAAYRAAGRAMDTPPPLRFLTASLHVDYLRPTPLGVPLEVRARVKEIKGRKVVVEARLLAEGEVCARGEVVAVQVPEHLIPDSKSQEVDAYLQGLEPGRRAALETLRSLVFDVVPEAVETMRYRMPTYERGGDVLCAFASQKHHLSLYVDPRLVEKHRGALGSLSLGKSCIRFRRIEDLPLDTVTAILQEAVQMGRGG